VERQLEADWERKLDIFKEEKNDKLYSSYSSMSQH